MAYDYAAINKRFRQHKSNLTRAINSKDPHKVISTVDKTFAEWDQHIDAGRMPAYPDDWARWQRAREDAHWALRRAQPDPIFQSDSSSIFHDRRS